MKLRFILATAAAGALLLSGCGGDATNGDVDTTADPAPVETGDDADPGESAEEPTEPQDDAEPVTLSFWHNSTTGPGAAYWEETTAKFTEENPHVTFDIQVIQNEDMDGRLQTAINAGDSPDIFMARGGGKLKDIVDAGQVMDMTDRIDPAIMDAYGSAVFEAFTIDGKIYAVPNSILPGGIFYSQDLFDEAGIEGTPSTIEELIEAADALKAAGHEPIALGGQDAWPAAHWYYFFALRTCSQDTINEAGATMDFSDPCWIEAGQNLKDFADAEPFNQGFLTTSAQQGAGSSAGMLANHVAGMELMGAWNVGVIAGLTPDEEPLPDLGWFPFPEVPGGAGAASAMMGGADGYSCAVGAPDVCADFLNFSGTKENQEAYAIAFNTLPANSEAKGVIEEPAMLDILDAYEDADYMMLWLDTLLGQNVGNALNGGVVDMLAGQGSPEDIVSAVESAALR